MLFIPSTAAAAELGSQLLLEGDQLGWSESKWRCCTIKEVHQGAACSSTHCRVPQHLQCCQRSVEATLWFFLLTSFLCILTMKVLVVSQNCVQNNLEHGSECFTSLSFYYILCSVSNISIKKVSKHTQQRPSFTCLHNDLMVTFPDNSSWFKS